MRFLLSTIIMLVYLNAFSQVDNSQLGSWYMYFFNNRFKNSQFGIQGDYQYRDWQILGDKEQLLLRSGFTYTADSSNVTFTLGYASITSGAFGDSDNTSHESRIYQEVLIPQKLGNRFYLTHRFRYEQRWVEDQDFRTRYRYNIFINVPINQNDLTKNAVYIAFYNELFVNGQKNIGNNQQVELFDRNRTYFGMGYALKDNLRVQTGWMNQKTDNWEKGQLQFSLHHTLCIE